MKRLFLLFLVVAVSVFSSCEKEGPMGPQGEKGEQGDAGPSAKTFNFSLTFNPGDLGKTYSGVTGFDADDIILIFTEDAATNVWIELPVVIGDMNLKANFNGQTGDIYVYTKDANNTSYSPWSNSSSFNFKAVLIKSSQREMLSNLDLNSYKAVKEAFKLAE